MGSLATLASDRRPLPPPRSTTHGSRLPAISRGELQVDLYTVAARTKKEKPRRRQRDCSPKLKSPRISLARVRS
jgi:hypothetical protein